MRRKTVSIILILAIPLLYIGVPAKKPQDKLTITRFEQNKPFQGRPKPTPTPIPDMATDVNLETRVKIYCFNQTEFTLRGRLQGNDPHSHNERGRF